MISFYYQHSMLVLTVFGVLWVLLLYASWRTGTSVIRLWGSNFHVSTVRYTLKSLLLLVAGVLLLGALLRPQSDIEYVYQEQVAPVVLIALDISRSMNVCDTVNGTARCIHAQKIITQIVDTLPESRVGLLLFADRAWMQIPPTVDRGVIKDAVAALDAHMLVRSGTHIGGVFEYLAELSSSNRMYAGVPIIIITDGEQSTQHSFKKYPGGAVLLIGVGSVRGGPIPEYNEQGVITGHLKSSTGDIILSHADFDFLHKAAQELGGVYIAGDTGDTSDIIHAANNCIARASDTKSGYLQGYAYEYWILLVKIAWLLLALEFIL